MSSGVDGSGRAEARAGSTVSIAVTAAALALVLASTAVGATVLQERSADALEAKAEARAAEIAVSTGTALNDALSTFEGVVDVVAVGGPAAIEGQRVPAFEALGSTAGGDAQVAALVSRREVRDAMARARDSASLVVSAPTDESEVVLVRALYGDGPVSAKEAGLPTPAGRRTELASHVLGVLDVDALVGDRPGRRHIGDGGTVLAGSTGALDDTVEVEIPVLERQWVVSEGVDSPSAIPVWLVLGLGASASLAVFASGRAWLSTVAGRVGEARQAGARADAVITYAGVLQESYDLGEVVPALAVELSDRLDLLGVSLCVVGNDGRLREVFVHGEAPDRTVGSSPLVPSAAAAGRTIGIHLRRAERSIGELWVRCGRDLGPSGLDQVRIAGELITSTVVATRSMEQQQEAMVRLRSLDELKTAFLGTASHELRTPVTAISGFAFMLSERWDSLSDGERKVFADRIASNARVLDTLVQDLLDFARLERNELRLVVEPVDLALVAERVLDRLEPVWATHAVERSITPGSFVTGDVAALERVVTNLVSNAVKFSPRGSTVWVSVERDDPVRLIVDDAGAGVPVSDRENIFERFYRGSGDAVVRTNGVGIGLSVVKEYLTRMGGQIRVGTSPAGGARFEAELERYEEPRPQERESTDVTT